jgi:hypothetical protein
MKKKFLFSPMLVVFSLAVLMLSTSAVEAQDYNDEIIINTLIAATLPENQDSVQVRMEAVETLWHFFDPRSPARASRIESAILAASKDNEPKVRGMAAESLDVMTSRESLEVLVLLSADNDKEVSEIANRSLMPRVSDSFAELADMISNGASSELRLAALRVIHSWTHSPIAPPSVRRSS